jgi:hypothetical protein
MKLLYGGKSKSFLIAGIRVTVVGPDLLSPAEIMVFEEDTNLILTVDKEIHWQEEHPIRQMTAILRAVKHPPGSLIRNGKNWSAVVVDLDSDIVCRANWIAEAYGKLFTVIQHESITTAAIHLLGSIHGKIGEKTAVRLLIDGLRAAAPQGLKEVQVITRLGHVESVRRMIKEHAH